MTSPGGTRNGRTPGHADDRRRALRDAAARLFEARGYHGTSVDDVAAAAGLNKGTLYHYFKSKSEILAAIYTDTVDALLESIAEIPAAATPPEALARLIRIQVEQVAAHPHDVVVYFQEGRRLHHWLPTRQCRSIRDRERHYRSYLENLVKRGIDDGSFALADAGMVANAVIGMTAWTYQWFTTNDEVTWFKPGSPKPAREIADSFVQLIINGLLAPQPSAAD